TVKKALKSSTAAATASTAIAGNRRGSRANPLRPRVVRFSNSSIWHVSCLAPGRAPATVTPDGSRGSDVARDVLQVVLPCVRPGPLPGHSARLRAGPAGTHRCLATVGGGASDHGIDPRTAQGAWPPCAAERAFRRGRWTCASRGMAPGACWGVRRRCHAAAHGEGPPYRQGDREKPVQDGLPLVGVAGFEPTTT